MGRKDIEKRIRQWEAEGYDVSDLRQKWFPRGSGGRSLAWIILSVVVAVVVLVIVSSWSQYSPGRAPGTTTRDPAMYTLSTATNPSGSGSVTPSSGTYDAGTTVTLTATPATGSGYAFSHWSGDATGTSTTTTVTMDRDRHVVVSFVKVTYRLTTAVSPPGSGSVTPSSGTYDAGTTVTLTAASASDYLFSHWSGDATGTSATTTVTMDRDRHVTANLEKLYQPIEFTISGVYVPGISPDPQWVQYHKSLEQGEEVEGSVELRVGPLAMGWYDTWWITVYDPAGNVADGSRTERLQQYSTVSIQFRFVAAYEGEYWIRINQRDFYDKPGTLTVWRPGWK